MKPSRQQRELAQFHTLEKVGVLHERGYGLGGAATVVLSCLKCSAAWTRFKSRAETVRDRVYAARHVAGTHPVTFAAHCGSGLE